MTPVFLIFWFPVSSSPSLARNNPLRADLILLLVTLLAAFGWMFSKETLVGLPPLLFMGLRFFFAGLLLVSLSLRQLNKLDKKQWMLSSQVGLLLGIAMSCWVFGLFYTNSLGEGAFITSLAVVIVPLVNWVLFKERPNRAMFIALPLAILGMALLSLRHGFTVEASQMYFLVAALIMSVTFILNSHAAAITPALALSAIQLVLVGLVAFVLSIFLEVWPTQAPSMIWLWLFLSITLATSARFLLQTYAQGLASANRAAVIMILEPVWTAIIAIFWFNQYMASSQLIGCGLILMALLVNRWQDIRQLVVKH